MAWWGCLTSSCCSSSVGVPGGPLGAGLDLASKLELSFSRVWLTESASSGTKFTGWSRAEPGATCCPLTLQTS